MFIGVYNPVLAKERDDFWNELGAIRRLWHNPWCVGGDFNVVRFPKEMRNCQRSPMRRFSQFIKEMCLKDLPLFGGLKINLGKSELIPVRKCPKFGGACKGFKMQGGSHPNHLSWSPLLDSL
ncbi:hypothetical protein CK203_029119 [Vitis vinifera]|uniref:Endonuclease/exonuclease/phosphatase domain-containing protein n=1 Tax=Vitis vinifera TaxID=29760 RepID=A0A438IMU4_VITVI|nr:hypothetical protein CK203_029119 [Vitis vinifera]